MRNLKRILLALIVAVSMGAFSSVSLAEKAKIPPAEAIDAISNKVNAASALIDAGGESRDDVANLLKQAKDLSKEVSANDKVDFKRQKAQGELKRAIAAAKAGKMEEAKEAIKSLNGVLAEMKSLI
jgi:hypothetical protein